MSRKRTMTVDVPQAPNPTLNRHGIFIPLGVLADDTLSPSEKLCLGYLNYCSAKTNRCEVYRETVASAISIPLRTVDRLVDGLENAGFLRCRRNGPGRSNSYFMLPHPSIIGTRKKGEDTYDWKRRNGSAEAVNPGGTDSPPTATQSTSTDSPPVATQSVGTDSPSSAQNGSSELLRLAVEDSPPAATHYKEHKNSSREVFTRSRQAGETGELVENPDASKCDTEENPPACPPTSTEIAAEEGGDLPSDAHRVLEAVFTEKGIVIRDPKHVTEILEAASAAACPTELVAEFIREMAAKKGIEKSTLMRDVVLEHLAAWMNRAEGRAAAAAIEAAATPVVRPECSVCGETGIRKNTPSNWCCCAIGELRRQRDEVVFVKGEECINCAATLQWHTRVNPEKALCFFCSRPEQNGSRVVTEFEIATARTQLQARVAIPECKRCWRSGSVTQNASRENESVEFCQCGWGARLRRLKGEGWAEEETQRARDLWQRLNAACPGRRAEVKSETRAVYLANGQPAGEM